MTLIIFKENIIKYILYVSLNCVQDDISEYIKCVKYLEMYVEITNDVDCNERLFIIYSKKLISNDRNYNSYHLRKCIERRRKYHINIILI